MGKSVATVVTLLILIAVLAITPSPAGTQGSWPAPPQIPDHWSATLDSAITAVRISDNGLYVSVATESGEVSLYSGEGEIIWRSRLRGPVTLLDSDPETKYVVAVSEASEIAVFKRDGTLAKYWERGSRDTPRSLVYVYSSGTITLLDESGWLYTYQFPEEPPQGRGEAWVLDYEYVSKNYNATTIVSPTSFGRMYGLVGGAGPLDEVVVPVYIYVLDSRGDKSVSYQVPMLRFYDAESAANIANIILKDLREYEVDSLYYYTIEGKRYVAVSAHREAGDVVGPGDYVLRLYSVENPISSGAGLDEPFEATATWSYDLGNKAIDLKATPNGAMLFAASLDYNIYCFKREGEDTYSLLWSASLGAGVSAMDVSEEGITAGGTADGWIYMYNAEGDRLWRAPFIGNITDVDITPQADRLAAGSGAELHVFSSPARQMRLLEVRLFGEQGPITGANVTVEDLEGNVVAKDQTPALFLLPKGTYLIMVGHIEIGTYAWELKLQSDQVVAVPSYKLTQPNYTTTVIVLDNETGRPVEGAEVTLNNELTGAFYTAKTGPDGKATFNLPRGPYRLEVNHKAYDGVTMNLGWILEPSTFEVRLTPLRARLRLGVTSPIIGPLEGITVKLSGPENVTLTTGPGGIAEADVRLGVYTVVVSAPHHETLTTTIEVWRETSTTLRLQPTNYTLQIVAVDRRTGEQLKQIEVQVSGPLGIEFTATLTSTNNTLVLPYGTYTLTLIEEHYRPTQLSVSLEEDTTITEKLEPLSYPVTLKVYSKLGEPLAQALIEAYLKGALYIKTYTNKQGVASTTLPYGKYVVSVRAEHHETVSKEILVDQPLTITLTAEPVSYNFTATIVDSEFQSKIPSGQIMLYRGETEYGKYRFTDGLFTTVLPYGEYTAKVVAPDHVEAKFKISITNDTQVKWELSPIEYTVTIRVLDDRGKPLSGATIIFSGPRTFTSYTDPEGTFSATLRSGTYTVTIQYKGYHEETLTIGIPGPLEHTVKLRPFLTTLIKRYLPLIVALIVIPGAIASIAYYLRRRRLKELEEEILEEEEII